jgi:hypothetical protein
MAVILNHDAEMFRWKFHVSGTFSVKSVYMDLVNDKNNFRRKFIWKLKVPLRIWIFIWYICRGVVLAKDNLAKLKWNGS